ADASVCGTTGVVVSLLATSVWRDELLPVADASHSANCAPGAVIATTTSSPWRVTLYWCCRLSSTTTRTVSTRNCATRMSRMGPRATPSYATRVSASDVPGRSTTMRDGPSSVKCAKRLPESAVTATSAPLLVGRIATPVTRRSALCASAYDAVAWCGSCADNAGIAYTRTADNAAVMNVPIMDSSQSNRS